MIIKRLILHNFGVYAGTNTFEFQEKKPVILIGGLNGRGKTTFLDAVLLALYGSNSFAYMESKFTSYGQYLRSFVNQSDGSLETFLKLEFQIESVADECYMIHREWDAVGKRTRERIEVFKDGKQDDFLTEHWSMFIENVLPSGLSSFFFFDGEKIARFAVDHTDVHMKESIKSLLGISILDILEKDVKKISRKSSVKEGTEFSVQRLNDLRTAKEEADKAVAVADAEILELEKTLSVLSRKLENSRNEYAAQGGNLMSQKQTLYNEKKEYDIKRLQEEDALLEIAASELPLKLVSPLIKRIRLQANKEYEGKATQLAIEKMQVFLEKYKKEDTKESKIIQNFLDYMVEENIENRRDNIFNISDTSRSLLELLLEQQLQRKVKEAVSTNKKLARIQKCLDEIEGYLSIDVDEKLVGKIYRTIKELEQQIIDTEVKLDFARKNRSTLNGMLSSATTQFNQYIGITLKQMELNDENERIFKYSQMAIHILDIYKVKLQSKKVDWVAETMTKCYRKLADKKNLIHQIKMDAKTLDIRYLDENGYEVPVRSLSAGETQLMVISLLWALAICAKRKFPVIIDTPLSRLDSRHRESVIKNYFPYASEQTIILSTDSEIDDEYHNLLRDVVGDEFTLIYDDKSKSTSVYKGYFKEI